MSRSIEEISEGMEGLFPALVDLTHRFVAETFQDQKNYTHYFGRTGLLYLFVFINQICTNEGFQDVSSVWFIWQRVFRALGIADDVATRAFETALDLSVKWGHAANSGQSEFWPLLLRIVSDDVAQFDWTSASQHQADHYALIVALDR